MEVRLLLKAVARHAAALRSEEPPPYTADEVAALHAADIEAASGGGVLGRLRDDPGWESEEARAKLDAWERGARSRLEAAARLPPERWYEVYEREEELLQEGDT